MRSTGLTLFLALAAVLIGAAGFWQWREGNFDGLFGSPPVAIGQRLFDGVAPEDVRHIRVSVSGVEAVFSRHGSDWQAESPWRDRMDPRAAAAIIRFTFGMRVEDLAEARKIDPSAAGLGDQAVEIRLEDVRRRSLAGYRLGGVAPWMAEVEGADAPLATVFVRPLEKTRKGHVYLCAGDITPLFKEGLKFLRDHRPFHFNPADLAKIRIRSQQGDLSLGRESAGGPWRIIKPLDLPTDPLAVRSLLEGLFNLQATRVMDRSELAPPAVDAAAKPGQISITSFGPEAEIVLELLPAESPDAEEVRATVSDRPGTLFVLPLKPEPGMVSLSGLPLGLNDLRDPVLTRLNVAALRSISIQPATGPAILISREPSKPWMVEINGVRGEASEENLFRLLKAVTTSRATGFESDAATDFTPWGLDRPVLNLTFLSHDHQAFGLRFGMDARGGVFANRSGTPTVMRVDESFLPAVAVRPYEWRHSRLWSVDRVNLLAISRSMEGRPPLVLRYRFNEESWEASRDGVDLGAKLDPARANHMLAVLEGLKVSRWLAADDEAAAAALASPMLRMTVTELTVDADGETSGVMDRSLVFAPADVPGFYYGRLDGESHPFLLDAETYGKLSMELLEP
jgi:hypothetical protein